MTFSRLVREPLIHFMLLGFLLFALFAWVNRDAMYAPDEIVIDDSLVSSMQQQFANTWLREPTPEELQGLVENWTREEILFREGVALGLEVDDTVIRRRVVQKMEFITESMAETPPTEVELKAWLEAHPENYQIPAEYTFRQIYFEPSRHPNDLRAVMDTAYQKLQSGDAVVNGDSSLLPVSMENVSEPQVSRVFGQEFANGIKSLALREWSEPVRSGFGFHFVYVESKQPGRLANLSEVRQTVESDFSHAQMVTAREAMFEALADRYNIIYASPAVAQQAGALTPDAATSDTSPTDASSAQP